MNFKIFQLKFTTNGAFLLQATLLKTKICLLGGDSSKILEFLFS